MDAVFAVLPVYFFILLGFSAKKIFTNQLDEKTLVLISLYFFQPILIFWGLTKTPINYELIASPFAYLSIVLICLVFLLLINKKILIIFDYFKRKPIKWAYNWSIFLYQYT